MNIQHIIKCSYRDCNYESSDKSSFSSFPKDLSSMKIWMKHAGFSNIHRMRIKQDQCFSKKICHKHFDIKRKECIQQIPTSKPDICSCSKNKIDASCAKLMGIRNVKKILTNEFIDNKMTTIENIERALDCTQKVFQIISLEKDHSEHRAFGKKLAADLKTLKNNRKRLAVVMNLINQVIKCGKTNQLTNSSCFLP